MAYNFKEYSKDKISKPRNTAWGNWMKFEKVGDKVQGYIRDVFYRPAEGMFKEGRCFTLEQANGELINVATKRLPFVMAETDKFRIGDPLTLELTELKPSATKGFNATKIISTFGTNLPENTGTTVKELEAEDMKNGNPVPSQDLEATAEEMKAGATDPV